MKPVYDRFFYVYFTKNVKYFIRQKTTFFTKRIVSFTKEMIKIKLVMLHLPQLKTNEVKKMIDKICNFLTNKIRKEMPEMDDEKAEVINYGLQNIIGEIPKIFITLGIALVLGIFDLTFYTFVILLPYKAFSGGFHLKTHLGCILFTTLFYCGIAFFSKYIFLNTTIKYIIILLIWIFGMVMVKLYAPADTENVPILRKNDRRKKQVLSYWALTIGLIVATFINNNEITNILILGNFIQTLCITKFVYRITNNKYGYEVYGNS